MLQFNPKPLDCFAPPLRNALAVQNPTVLLDDASRGGVVLVAREQYAFQASQSSFLQHEHQHVRGVPLSTFRWAHAVADVPAIIPKGIGQPMAQAALAEDMRTAHQQEYARRNTVRRGAKAVLPLPNAMHKTRKVAANFLKHTLSPGLTSGPILLQVRDTLLASGFVGLDKLHVPSMHASIVTRIGRHVILPCSHRRIYRHE